MSKHNKSYRIRTSVGVDNHYINFNMNQSYNKFEILSLEINQDNAYRLMQSNTGIIVGRVVANGGFGIPNAKLSIFVEYDGSETHINDVLYRYTSPTSIGNDSVRYNLIYNDSGDDCYQDVGTFPTKRYLLDNNDEIEVFEKYYKYTTRTNNSGDYMIYGVPTGNNVLHCDIDLSDIGVLSQTPRDMMYHGYNKNLFESASKFKKDKNLSSLSQIITQDKSLYVYPFWGDTTESSFNAAITRCDIQISYKFESTCVFLGSVITDTGSNGIGKKCKPTKGSGKMSDMITGTGRIEMIRKTQNGSIEQFSVQGNELIDESGTWCYQIPMNLDYVVTDEYGNTVLSDNPEKGIATRSRVRFRISMTENPADGVARKRARYLIPNNPRLVEEDYPSFSKTKNIDYEFGSKTKDENFRDLMWNNVYTIKNYIPRLQKSRLPNNLQHLGIKKVNHPGDNNPMPYNKLSIKFNFMYTFICVLIKVLVTLTRSINVVINFFQLAFLYVAEFCGKASNALKVFKFLAKTNGDQPEEYGDEYSGDDGGKNWVGLCLRQLCLVQEEAKRKGKNWGLSTMVNKTKNPKVSGVGALLCSIVVKIGPGITLSGLCEDENGIPIDITPVNRDSNFWQFMDEQKVTCFSKVDSDVASLYNCVENQLAQENEVTSFNFYNDWVNGVLYLPLWFRKIKPKKTFLGIQINPHRERWCNGVEHVKNRDLKVYNNCVIKRKVSGKDELQPLVDDYDTVNVIKSVADDDSGKEKLVFVKENDDNCFGYQCHKYGRSETPLPTGLIIEKETIYGEKVYYYKPSFFSKNENDMVTLFATDIVLLGSLNKCDIHGIPQFFKILEGTSYQMPPDLLSEEYKYSLTANTKTEFNTDENENELIDENSRYSEYTGADWGNLGADQSNYKNGKYEVNENIYDNGGLFYGLTCWDSYTKPKSIINLERICEIGVSLDESQELLKDKSVLNSSTVDDDSLYVNLTPDGYISYDEIYNPDYRSMFATMNGNFLKTKLNFETGLTEYDLTHVYLDNFDGSLFNIMKGGATQGTMIRDGVVLNEKANYRNNYKLEVADKNYIRFRYGNYLKHNNKIVYYYQYPTTMTMAINKHEVRSENKFPRYENSFYFYFGLKNGHTAIDRFYNDYYADCTPDQDFGKAFEFKFVGNEWCSEEGGYIEFNHELDLPIKLNFINKDVDTKTFIAENINYNKFYVGTQIDGMINYVSLLDSENTIISSLPSGNYFIEIIDNNGEVYYDEVEFHLPYLTYDVSTQDFNLSNQQLMDKYPCGSENYNYIVTDNNGDKINLTPIPYKEYGGTVYVPLLDRGFYLYGTDENNDGDIEYKNRNVEDIYVENGQWKVLFSDGRIENIREYDAINYVDVNGNVVVTVYTKLRNNSSFSTGELIQPGYTNFQKSTTPSINYYNDVVMQGMYETEFGFDRKDGGYIMVSNVTTNLFKIEVIGDNTVSDWNASCIVEVDDSVNILADTHTGFWGEKNGVYYFGVPKGDETYKVVVTEICEYVEVNGVIESVNSSTSNVTVYEGLMKLYINNIDYDLIKKFKTGWDKVYMNNTNTTFNSSNVKGWNDLNNIGLTNDSVNSIQPIIQVKSEYVEPDLFDINEWVTIQPIDIINPIIGNFGVINNKVYVCVDDTNDLGMDNWVEVDYVEYSQFNNYNENDCVIRNNVFYYANTDIIATEKFECINLNDINTIANDLIKFNNNNEYSISPYTWDGDYVILEKKWNSLANDFSFTYDSEGRLPGEDNYEPTYEGDLIDKCELINTVINNRIEFTRQVQGAFRLTTKGYLEVTLLVSTKSKPVQYLIVDEQQNKNQIVIK